MDNVLIMNEALTPQSQESVYQWSTRLRNELVAGTLLQEQSAGIRFRACKLIDALLDNDRKAKGGQREAWQNGFAVDREELVAGVVERVGALDTAEAAGAVE